MNEVLSKLHREAFAAIARDKTHVGNATARADQVVDGLRHVLCMWILTEATEAQLDDIVKRYFN